MPSKFRRSKTRNPRRPQSQKFDPARQPARGWQLEAEHFEGIEDLARNELAGLGGHVRVLKGGDAESTPLLFRGDLNLLRKLRLSTAIYRVYHVEIPRPKALLGHANWLQLQQVIETVTGAYPFGTFRTFRIAAAGRFSSVFQRIKETFETDTGLRYDEDEADLQLRIRPARYKESGWEVLIRLTPRPLSTRAWRTFNMRGALNGAVAAAMVELSQPASSDRYLNMMCGTGTLLIERALAGRAAQLVGGDLNEVALVGGKKNIAEADADQSISLLQFDGMALPFSDDSFDVIVADPPWGQMVGSQEENEVLYPAMLAEAARVAAPMARLLILTHSIRHLEETAEQFRHLWQLKASRKVFQGGLHPRIYQFVRL